MFFLVEHPTGGNGKKMRDALTKCADAEKTFSYNYLKT